MEPGGPEGGAIGIAISEWSALGVPAVLAISGHPAVTRVTLSRALGDHAGQHAALRAVPCLLLDFASEAAADEALARLRAISARFTFKERPTRIACSNGVGYTLRLVRDFDEATIAAIDAHAADVAARYAAAQQGHARPAARRGRR